MDYAHETWVREHLSYMKDKTYLVLLFYVLFLRAIKIKETKLGGKVQKRSLYH
jgi:hypothetical protein